MVSHLGVLPRRIQDQILTVFYLINKNPSVINTHNSNTHDSEITRERSRNLLLGRLYHAIIIKNENMLVVPLSKKSVIN